MTVNAVLLANNVSLYLGGHTLTLKSGVIRPQGKFGYYVKNGTVATEKPLTTSDAVNNADVRFSAALAYAGTGEGVVAFNSWGGSHPGIEQFTNYTGKVYWGNGGTITEAGFPGLFLEYWNGGSLGATGHSKTMIVQGLGGAFSIRSSGGKWHEVYWLGSTNDVENLREKTRRVVIAPSGKLALGAWWDDGFRKGDVKFSFDKSNGLYGIQYVDMLGGTLEVTLRPDGEATTLDLLAGSESNPGTVEATLGGELQLVEAGKFKPGDSWKIIRTRTETTGYFTNAGANGKGIPGYKVNYNVLQDDGTYACEIVRRGSRMFIILR